MWAESKKQCVLVLAVALIEWSVAWCCGHSLIVSAGQSIGPDHTHAHRHHHGPFEHEHSHEPPADPDQDNAHEREKIGVRHLNWDKIDSACAPLLEKVETGKPCFSSLVFNEPDRHGAVWVRAGPCLAIQSGRDHCLRSQRWRC